MLNRGTKTAGTSHLGHRTLLASHFLKLFEAYADGGFIRAIGVPVLGTHKQLARE